MKKKPIFTSKGLINEIKRDFRKSCPYLDEDYPMNIKEYKFKVKNALNMEREYQIYYMIVPPQK